MNKFYFLITVALGATIFLLATLIPWGNVDLSETETNPDTQPVTLTCNVTGTSVQKMKNKSTYFIETEDCGKLPANAHSILEVRSGHQYELTTGEGSVMRWVIQTAKLVK